MGLNAHSCNPLQTVASVHVRPTLLGGWLAPLTASNKWLANAKRPCGCSVMCLRPKSSLCSCPHCILDITSFDSADSVRRASNNGVGQFKPIFHVEGNIFRPIFFRLFYRLYPLYNFAAGSFHTTKLCSRLCSIEIEFHPEKLKNRFLSRRVGDLGVTVRVTYALHL